MKYFVNSEELNQSRNAKLVEFQSYAIESGETPKDSIYILRSLLQKTGAYDFWVDAMVEDIVFDLDSISPEEWDKLFSEAKGSGGTILEVFAELRLWIEGQFAGVSQKILVNWD